MKLLACAGILAAASLSSLLGTTAPAQGAPDKVAICHVPPGNPSNVRSITVGAASVAEHLREHGDFYDLDGTWSGLFSQPPFQPYPIIVAFRNTCSPPGSVVASVDYPTFPCSGTWTLQSAASTTFVVEESLPGSACIQSCRYALTLVPVAGQINLAGLVSCPFNPETWTAVLTRTATDDDDGGGTANADDDEDDGGSAQANDDDANANADDDNDDNANDDNEDNGGDDD